MILRKGFKKDLKAVYKLIEELAKYEKAESKLINTYDQMINDGFNEYPLFKILIAEQKDYIIGILIYYFRYSTWKGKILYIEDFIVKKEFRKKGVGGKLLNYSKEIAKEENCKGISLQALDWNINAKKFYKKNNFTVDNEWINCHLDI